MSVKQPSILHSLYYTKCCLFGFEKLDTTYSDCDFLDEVALPRLQCHDADVARGGTNCLLSLLKMLDSDEKKEDGSLP